MKKTLKTFAVVSAMSIMAVAIAGCGSRNATQSGVSQIDTPLITDTANPVYKDDSDMTTTVKDSILKKMDGETFYFQVELADGLPSLKYMLMVHLRDIIMTQIWGTEVMDILMERSTIVSLKENSLYRSR